MSSALSRSFGGLSASLKEEVMVTSQKQGIISLLPTAPSDRSSPPPLSLRRTLSADMSSKAWLNRDSSSAATALKKIASSNELRLAEDEPEQREEDQAAGAGAGMFDTWSAIMSAQKKEEDGDSPPPPPYIHPLVRQSKSTLSEKSLEICTESLGSETGCDGFSSYPGSESGENEEEEETVEEGEEKSGADPPQVTAEKLDMEEDIRIAKLNAGNLPICGVMKKSPPRSFPPPIPSLSRGAANGSSLHMRPRRDNGRLVLEAVSFASQNNFRAQREDGRLVLTFVPNQEEKATEIAAEEQQFEVELENPATETLETEVEEEEIEMEDEEEETEENDEEMEFVKEEAPKLTSGPMSVHRLAVMMNKPISRNPTWPKQVVHNSEAAEEEVMVMKPINHPMTQSLPPRPPRSAAKPVVGATTKIATAAAATHNPYECYWKSSSKLMMPTSAVTVAAAAAELVGPITQNSAPTKNVNISDATKIAPSSMEKDQLLEQRRRWELVVKRGGDHFVPWIKGCKEPRRSLLFWEPHCIATS